MYILAQQSDPQWDISCSYIMGQSFPVVGFAPSPEQKKSSTVIWCPQPVIQNIGGVVKNSAPVHYQTPYSLWYHVIN